MMRRFRGAREWGNLGLLVLQIAACRRGGEDWKRDGESGPFYFLIRSENNLCCRRNSNGNNYLQNGLFADSPPYGLCEVSFAGRICPPDSHIVGTSPLPVCRGTEDALRARCGEDRTANCEVLVLSN